MMAGKKVRITNLELKKPWLLIALYECLWDKLDELKLQLFRTTTGADNGKQIKFETEMRISMLKDAITRTQECLRETDTKIHKYISSHQSGK